MRSNKNSPVTNSTKSVGNDRNDLCHEIVYRPLDQLKLDPKNPRQHSRQQIRQISRSIEAFGFVVPVLVDKNRKVVAGHGRVLASRELGLATIPTISLNHLNKAQVQAFNIADNRLTDNSSWNEQLLAEQLKELSLLDLDFSLEATGFEMGEIDLRIESLNGELETEEDEADAIPNMPAGPEISKPGDLWKLGRHRVYCGNALEPISYANLMKAEKAAVVFADPPYNVPIIGHVSGLGSIQHREFSMGVGEMDKTQFTNFLTRIFRLQTGYSVDGSIHYLCMDWRHMGEILAAGSEVYSELKNLCVWSKHNAGMGSFYRSQHELVFVFKHGRKSHRNNVQLGRHGRHRSNAWFYRGANDFGRNADEGNLLALHPTIKPVALVADAILDSSLRGNIILDPFLGSGTTVVAAEKVGRCCYGIEIDPTYVDTIIRRWQSFTGDHAIHETTGKLFHDYDSKENACLKQEMTPTKKKRRTIR